MAEERLQRRLAAILAADVVGYSRLIEADEEGTRRRLRSFHDELINPRIAAGGGRIVKTTGDGILAEFPSAVDAVRSALAIQSIPGRHQSSPRASKPEKLYRVTARRFFSPRNGRSGRLMRSHATRVLFLLPLLLTGCRGWLVHETEHLSLRYRTDSYAARNIETAVER